ncbi:MAG TPA: hypothetical protein DIW07_11605 [Lachnospiraceae bacterium]|jgi:group II intron reverse transcriptase/maturase|nr:hypothetical protein [Lachnospiraceae bacterium]
MTTKTQRLKKKQKIRNNEYYNTQTVFDDLYSKAINNQNFYKLYDIITSEQNILLAYRNIKKNKGSKTSGTNKNSIIDIGDNEPEKLVNYIRQRMGNFIPHSVRRVEIEKENGKKRPLGIPTIEDRLIQQCIKQVLEPICEAKFHNHSYGFRPNRGTHHAIARALFLTNLKNHQYVVDIDIKGFFDNVNHGKLLKQMWSLGIRDKRLLCIISKMLKAEVKGIGIPDKGVPQGGILSPLLSNIVLNELDWWISSQWETNPIRKRYRTHQIKGSKGTLKKIYIVRYADDFKLFCNNRADAGNIFIATQNWLKERLGYCMDGKEYPNPYAGGYHYTPEDVSLMEKILDEYIDDLMLAEGDPAAISECVKDAVLKINALNEECGRHLIDTWRRERLCSFINSAAETAGLTHEKDHTLQHRMW